MRGLHTLSQVANILAEYEVREAEESQPAGQSDVREEDSGGKKKKSVLREIKNGRVGKQRKSKGRKKN